MVSPAWYPKENGSDWRAVSRPFAARGEVLLLDIKTLDLFSHEFRHPINDVGCESVFDFPHRFMVCMIRNQLVFGYENLLGTRNGFCITNIVRVRQLERIFRSVEFFGRIEQIQKLLHVPRANGLFWLRRHRTSPRLHLEFAVPSSAKRARQPSNRPSFFWCHNKTKIPTPNRPWLVALICQYGVKDREQTQRRGGRQ